ncbi:MAG: hypothetical protein ACK55I_03690, partial [bacterium]
MFEAITETARHEHAIDDKLALDGIALDEPHGHAHGLGLEGREPVHLQRHRREQLPLRHKRQLDPPSQHLSRRQHHRKALQAEARRPAQDLARKILVGHAGIDRETLALTVSILEAPGTVPGMQQRDGRWTR